MTAAREMIEPPLEALVPAALKFTDITTFLRHGQDMTNSGGTGDSAA